MKSQLEEAQKRTGLVSPWSIFYIDHLKQNNKDIKSAESQLNTIKSNLKTIRLVEIKRKEAASKGEEFDEKAYEMEVRVQIDLEELKKVSVKSYLENSGAKLFPSSSGRKVCCCIKHNEKSPSMVIYEATNSFYCFGCGIGGGIIDLIMNMHNITMPEAIDFLKKNNI